MTRRVLLVAAAALVLLACSGGSTLNGDGGAADGGSPATSDAAASGDAAFGCTPGSYVFCRCSDRSEGTKACRPDGQSFDACATSTGPCP